MKSFVALFVTVLVLQASQVEPKPKSFVGYKVVTMTIENEKQLQELQNLDTQSGFTYWDHPNRVSQKLDLVVQPEFFAQFEELAQETDIKFEIATDNLQSWLDAEKPSKSRKEGFTLTDYNELEDIYQWLDDVVSTYETATVFSIGETYEYRPIKAVKITKDDNNPAFFIEANIHAREWISSATAVWLINEFLTTEDPGVRGIVDSLTWYIVPIANPDGFKFTHTDNRLWRKTRSIHNIFCRGADPNRNFEFNFNMGGASRLACSDTYMGPEAFSEKESKALADFFESISDKADAYVSFHSAAELLLYPMGHTNSIEQVHNVDDLDAIAEATVTALAKRYETVYKYGNVYDTIYPASGSSPDHAYGKFGTPIAYTYEFRAGRGTGSGFILPKEQISENSEEILDSLMAMVTKAKELNYFQPRV